MPFVGALLGAVAGLAGWGVAWLGNTTLGGAVAFGATVVLTGAIHLDGFMDGCDAFFARVPLERRLAILEDPRHGTFAIAGFGVVALVWSAALWSIAPASYPLALALAAASARWSAIVHAIYVPYRGASHGAAFARRPPIVLLILGLVLVVALAWPLGLPGAIAALAAPGVAGLSIRWARGRLAGGVTGDAYGFAIVLAEVGALFAMASMSHASPTL